MIMRARFKTMKINYLTMAERECHRHCTRPKCITERVKHHHGLTEINGSYNRSWTSIQYYLSVVPPYVPAIFVLSKTKTSIIDFFVYVSSSLSFWFGFLPFDLCRLDW